MQILAVLCIIISVLVSCGRCGRSRRRSRSLVPSGSCRSPDCSSLIYSPLAHERSSCICWRCKVDVIGWNCTKDTEYIKQEANCVTAIDGDQIKVFEQLFELDLNCNAIATIPARVFSNNGDLTKILLGHNRLDHIHAESFSGLNKLEELNLGNNQLKHLPDGVFRNLISLRKVTLSGNNFPSINTSWFPVTSSLTDLNMAQNALHSWPAEESDLKTLEVLVLKENQITSWGRTFYPKLKDLNLSYNQITIVKSNAFDANPVLQILDLSHNQLTRLDVHITYNLCHLKMLNVESNRLQIANPQWFANVVRNQMGSWKVVEGSSVTANNNWRCDMMQDMKKFLIQISTDSILADKKNWLRYFAMCGRTSSSPTSQNPGSDPLAQYLSPRCAHSIRTGPNDTMQKTVSAPASAARQGNGLATLKVAGTTIAAGVLVIIILLLVVAHRVMKKKVLRNKQRPNSTCTEDTEMSAYDSRQETRNLERRSLEEDDNGYLVPKPHLLAADSRGPHGSSHRQSLISDETRPKALRDSLTPSCNRYSEIGRGRSWLLLNENDETLVKSTVCPAACPQDTQIGRQSVTDYSSFTTVSDEGDVEVLPGYFTISNGS